MTNLGSLISRALTLSMTTSRLAGAYTSGADMTNHGGSFRDDRSPLDEARKASESAQSEMWQAYYLLTTGRAPEIISGTEMRAIEELLESDPWKATPN